MSSEERAYREFVGEEDPWASYSSVDTSLLEPDPTEPSIASSFWEGMKSGFMSSVRFARDAGGMFLEAGMNHRPFASVVLDQTYTHQSEYTHRMMERGTNFVTSMAGLGASFSETYLSSWGLNDTLGLPELSWEEKLLMATSPSLYFVNREFFNTSAYDIAYGVGEIVGNPINYAPIGLAFRTAGQAGRATRALPNSPSLGYHQHGFFGEESVSGSIGLTSRLNRLEIREYLSNAHTVPRDQLIKDLESIGIKFRGGSEDGRFMSFSDKYGNERVKIHPPDGTTTYDHIHIYDKNGRDLNADLSTVSYKSPEAHIPIASDELFYNKDYYQQIINGGY
jgi:hypothetical protein